jgi:hypothetical protein
MIDNLPFCGFHVPARESGLERTRAVDSVETLTKKVDLIALRRRGRNYCRLDVCLAAFETQSMAGVLEKFVVHQSF